MNKNHLVKFFEGLGAHRINTSGDQVHASCPFARWEHQGGIDKNPSFGAKASGSGSSPYNCFTCGASGQSMEQLLMQLEDYVEVPEEAWEFVRDHEKEHIDPDDLTDQIKEEVSEDPESADVPVWSEAELDPYRGEVPNYFLERGFSLDVAKQFDLGFDQDNDRLVIPIRDRQGNLVGMQGRRIHEHQEPRYYNYWNFPRSEVLFGIHSVPNDVENLIVVEGPMDVMRLTEYGHHAVAILGSSPSRKQVNMATWFDASLYLMTDGDNQGRKIIKQFKYYAPDEALLLDAQCPEGTDPDDLTYEDVQECLGEAQPLEAII